MLTNDVASFEQPGPDCSGAFIGHESVSEQKTDNIQRHDISAGGCCVSFTISVVLFQFCGANKLGRNSTGSQKCTGNND